MIFNIQTRKTIAWTLCLGVLFSAGNFPINANQQVQQDVVDGRNIPKFTDPLPIPPRVSGKKKLTVYAEEFQQKILPNSFYENLPSSVEYKSVRTGETLFEINPRKGTYTWGYKMKDGERVYGPMTPGPTIEVQRGTNLHVSYKNHLKPFKDAKGRSLKGPLLQKFFTVDTSFQWANPLKWPQFLQGFDTYDPVNYPYGTGLPQGNTAIYEGPQPMVVHLHGHETPSYSDGDPNSWFTPHKEYIGQSFVTDKYIYPSTMPATTLWYHDHVEGETRLNITGGEKGFYFIRGEPETSVEPPLPQGDYEIGLVVSDLQFDSYGQIFFPDGNPLTAGINGPPGNPEINPYAIPEFFGTAICVNGKTWPYLEVEPRRYRFRLLDGSSARMYGLYMERDDDPLESVPDMWQIGTDGGLLDKPVNLSSFIPFTYAPNPSPFQDTSTCNSDTCTGSCPQSIPEGCTGPAGCTGPGECQCFLCPPIGEYGGANCTVIPPLPQADNWNLGPVFCSPVLFIAPSERADIIIDFSGYEGKTITLKNAAPAPFPAGGTEFDPDVEGNVMQFRVTKSRSGHDDSFNPAAPDAKLRKGDQKIVRYVEGDHLAPGVEVNLTRSLVLIEQEDPFSSAPVVVMLNNTLYDGKNPYNGLPLPDSLPFNHGSVYVTEMPQIGSTEIWEIVNMTPDAHPIHIHLIQFQIMNRQVFNLGNIVPPFYCDNSYRYLYESLWADYFPIPPGVPPGTVYQYGPPLPYLSTPKLGGNPDVTPFLSGPLYPADPNEYGFKDVVKSFPGTVTRLVVRWSTQTPKVGEVKPGDNTFYFDPTNVIGEGRTDKWGYPGGSGYVWHCHITDHEDNMMMRPFEVRKHPQRPYAAEEK